MAEYMVQGLPMALARDGWWFDEAKPERGAAQGHGPRGGWVLLGLVGTADFLFWDQAGPGLSLAVFLLAIGVGLRGFAAIGRRDFGLVGLVLAVLPIVERVQALSLGFGVIGLLSYAVWLQAGQIGLILSRLPAVIGLFPRGVTDGARAMRHARRHGMANGGVLRGVRALALPLGLGLCFAGLLLMANPVLAGWFAFGDEWPNPARGLFWAGIAVLVWPVLQVPFADLRPVQAALPAWTFGGLINAGAVTSSLWLFNAMFAVQSVMDARYLWGGAVLPAGMSHAEYAHRGAYPLLVTALLAGLFALISKIYAAESRLVRGLLLVWIAQNVALVISAILRLQAYVEAYGLTYLRLDAAIWMGVVAVGLGLLAWAVLRGLDNRWLALRCGLLGVGVLYAACFVNFAAVIAAYNLSTRAEAGFDRQYNCHLGPDAWAAFQGHAAQDYCGDFYWGDGLDVRAPAIKGWRDWSYRSYRVLEQAHAYSDRG